MKVKQNIIAFILGMLVMLPIGGYAATAIKSAQYNNTKILLDGAELQLDAPFATVVNEGEEYGSNYAPLRAFFESLGYKVEWDNPTETVLLESPKTDLETVVKNCKDSCVMIYVYKDGVSVGQGSGFVYNGYIITAKHVTDAGDKYVIFNDNSIYGTNATLESIETDLDVSVLKTDLKLPSVVLGNSDKLVEGEKLVAITSPNGSQNAVDECIYTGISYTAIGNFIGISEANMLGGSSGGAVFNIKSEIIGMNVLGEAGVNDAIPINDLRQILDSLE
ncbi:MAG: trypsin-like peptidase domain-containing protein [Clostridiaceae bacterium]